MMVEGIDVFYILDSEKQPASHELTSFAHLTVIRSLPIQKM